MTDLNGLRYVGLGLVAENKPLGTKVVLFTWYEQNPLQTGSVVSNMQRLTSTYTDVKGVEQTATLYTDTARPALWLADDSMRITAPDVRRGEKIKLYQYADKDTLFWKEMGDGKGRRRGETIVLGASGRLDLEESSEGSDEDAVNHHYRIEMSGHKKIINLSTSAANGEPSTYTLLLDGGNGMISLSDAQGNELVLSTENQRWALRNNEGSYLVLDKKNILIGSEDAVYLQAKQQIAIETKRFFLNCDDLCIRAKNGIQTESGQWNHEGPMSLKGDWAFEGGGKALGGLSVTQDITTEGDVKTGQVSLNHHKHLTRKEGEETSIPIAV